MTDIKLFKIQDNKATELKAESLALEKNLQDLIEKNLETLFAVRLLASEYDTGPRHRGRIDTLGIDENGCPVVIEYKRRVNENVINQGLFYLDWLLDHQGEFELLVSKLVDDQAATEINWTSTRLLCIAADFARYDEHAVQQIDRNIELIRFRYFPEGFLLFELVNAVSEATSRGGTKAGTSARYKTILETIEGLDGDLASLYSQLRENLLTLGDDVQERALKYYIAFKRLRNFACVEVHPNKAVITLYLKVNPDTVDLQEGFTRDVRKIGHFGTGDLEVVLRNQEDLEKAMPLVRRSYEES